MKKKNKYILSKNLHYFIRKDFENSVNLQDNTIRFTLHCLWTSLFSLFVHRSVLKGTKKLKAAFPRPASFQSLVKRCWRRGRGRGRGRVGTEKPFTSDPNPIGKATYIVKLRVCIKTPFIFRTLDNRQSKTRQEMCSYKVRVTLESLWVPQHWILLRRSSHLIQ